jgi:hypothetical protein
VVSALARGLAEAYYIVELSGFYCDGLSVEAKSWGGIKNLYK